MEAASRPKRLPRKYLAGMPAAHDALAPGLPCCWTAVLDAFHVVTLGTQVVDEVRRRVQQRNRRSPQPQG
jgi:hypothetical protein